jgi:large-conductance mechanosensitive channel
MTSLLTAAGSAWVLADTTTPDPDTVTPGVIGFIVTFLVMAVTVLLVIDMVRRVRRVNYREQVRAELEEELAAQRKGDRPTR